MIERNIQIEIYMSESSLDISSVNPLALQLLTVEEQVDILSKVNRLDLLNICKENTVWNYICDNDVFWNLLYIHDFGLTNRVEESWYQEYSSTYFKISNFADILIDNYCYISDNILNREALLDILVFYLRELIKDVHLGTIKPTIELIAQRSYNNISIEISSNLVGIDRSSIPDEIYTLLFNFVYQQVNPRLIEFIKSY